MISLFRPEIVNRLNKNHSWCKLNTTKSLQIQYLLSLSICADSWWHFVDHLLHVSYQYDVMKAQQYSVLSRLTECAKLPTDCVEFYSALKQNGNHEQKCMLAKLRIINYEKNTRISGRKLYINCFRNKCYKTWKPLNVLV
jgi:hypothetical protein